MTSHIQKSPESAHDIYVTLISEIQMCPSADNARIRSEVASGLSALKAKTGLVIMEVIVKDQAQEREDRHWCSVNAIDQASYIDKKGVWAITLTSFNGI